MFSPICRASAAILVLAGLATPLAAEMTAEEITRAFENQKTRGLTLIPPAGAEAPASSESATISGTPAAAPAAPETQAAAASPAPAAVPAAQPDAAATPPAQVAYQPVEPQDQVNLHIVFGFDSAVMEDDQKAKLTTMCDVMRTVDVEVFQIIGHTDASGPAAYNENLSLLRAQEVKRHLVSECGISADRLQAVGMGEDAPLDPADPLSDDNRRVEFQALV